jgi:hypothetical protein
MFGMSNEPIPTPKLFPARLHVLLARDVPLSVVIRRGPSKQVCTLLWDRDRDEFTMGQWLKGRIYERRCDLSPDGKYMIYFAMNGKWTQEALGSWTAISRVPYLKAIALWPKGDCYFGGGLFTRRRTYWLNGGHVCPLMDSREVRQDAKFRPARGRDGECLSVYFVRLLRDGWVYPEAYLGYDVLERRLPDGWVLRKIAHAQIDSSPGKGYDWEEHELIHDTRGFRLRFPRWEWAERDRQRLVWAEGGKLFAGSVGETGLHDTAELMNFNGMTFEAIEAPY